MNKEIVIYTSQYDYFNEDDQRAVAISGKPEIYANWHGALYPALAPKMKFWKIWHDMEGRVSEEERVRYYVREYYLQVLKDLNPYKVLTDLGNEKILLCFEKHDEFCHRHLVAFWLELTLGIKTSEVSSELEPVSRPEYLKIILEAEIKKIGNDYESTIHFN